MTNSSCHIGWERSGSANQATQLCSHHSEAKQHLIINLSNMKTFSLLVKILFWLQDKCTADLSLPGRLPIHHSVRAVLIDLSQHTQYWTQRKGKQSQLCLTGGGDIGVWIISCGWGDFIVFRVQITPLVFRITPSLKSYLAQTSFNSAVTVGDQETLC